MAKGFKQKLSNQNFRFFYQYTGSSIFWVFLLSLVTGVLDALGISFLYPLILIADGAKEIEQDNVGGLAFFLGLFEKANVELSIKNVILLLITIFSMKGLLVYYTFYQKAKIRSKLIGKVRFQLIEGLQQFSYKKFITLNMGQMNASFTTEVGLTSSAFEKYLNSIQQLVMVITYLGMAMFMNAKFTLLILCLVPPMSLLFNYLNKITKNVSNDFKAQNRFLVHSFVQTLIFFKYLKATNVFPLYGNILKSDTRSIEKSRFKIATLKGVITASKEIIIILAVSGLILFQVFVVQESVQAIIIIMILLYRNFGELIKFQGSWQGYLGATGSLNGVKETLGLIQAGYEKDGQESLDHKDINTIECKNVNFSYGDKQILHDINLRVKKNQSIAFVGESGSGKTTIVNLLAGLYQASSGTVAINDTDIEALQLSSYRQNIGYITQEPVVFSGTIYKNVTLSDSKDPETVKQFWQACETAHVAQFIKELEAQENTEVGDFGVSLSGGQKQRLSIARELFRAPQILVMDEATSALDSETEAHIQANIDFLKGRLTLIIIAHRLSTVKDVDCIYLVDKGRIIHHGNYEALLQKSERFAQMVKIQNT